MATHLVNLDALIRREDFEAIADVPPGTAPPAEVIKLDELEYTRAFYRLLRKPDFQRVTSNWSPETIVGLVKSLLDGEIIPAIIVWYSPASNKVFVVDGAHRLSALIAWVNNDYGDGEISRKFWPDRIPSEQQRYAKRTANLVDEDIFTYHQLQHAHEDADASELTRRRAANLAIMKLPTQWIHSNDAAVAERAFININDNPATIDPTELSIIKIRRKPNAIATRALMCAGTGYKYWSQFTQEQQTKIEELAQDIYNRLFLPVVESPISTLDLPVAGHAYSGDSFKMLFDMVNIFNEITPGMWEDDSHRKRKRKVARVKLEDDPDGEVTLEYLRRVRRVGNLIAGNDVDCSLGLFPAVYFYSTAGKFYPAAFLAALTFAENLNKADHFKKFTAARADFEEFLLRHGTFVSDITHSKGSRTRPVDAIVTMYDIILENLAAGVADDATIVAALRTNPKLKDLKEIAPVDGGRKPRRDFAKDVVTAAYFRESLAGAIRCHYCGARVTKQSRTNDHVTPVSNGGIGSLDNLQFAHAYCNSSRKANKANQ
jgi:hypothetical protein